MELKVVSFNIFCADAPDGHSIPERASRLDKILKKINPDLIGIQEDRPAWEKYLNEYFGDEYEIFNVYRCQEDKESTPILWKKSKFNCIKKGCFWLSDTPEVESKGWDEKYDCYRTCLYVILEDIASGKNFTFMNTHFGFGDKGQCDSVELINKYRKEISDYPTFITGDFNMIPSSKGYKKMTEYLTDVNAVTVNDLRSTWHGFTPEIDKNEHIDYCFVSDNVKPLNQRIIDETIEGKFPSDHFGLEILIEI